MTTELIYTEVLRHCCVIVYNLILLQGCVPHLESYFHYIHSVVVGISIIIGAPEVLVLVCVIIALGKFLIDDLVSSPDHTQCTFLGFSCTRVTTI